MRKRMVFFVFVALFFFWEQRCGAAPIYGPKMPKKNQFFIGVQSHWVVRRSLEKEYGKMRSLQHFLLISYGFTEWLSLDLKGGAGNIKSKPSISNEIDYTSGLAGGYGVRLRLYEFDRSKIVFGFQHISAHPESSKIAETKHKAVLDDWQFSLLASHSFSHVTPYIGTRWSRTDHIHWIESDRKRERSDLTKGVGVIAGVEVPVHERAWFTVEGSLLDAESVAVSLTMAF